MMRRRGAERGSAMTELAILLLPYGLVAIGTMILGTLALGRQEVQEAVVLTGAIPGVQDESFVEQHALAGMRNPRWREVWFSEEEDPELEQNYENEEPVLPYRNTAGEPERDDIHAGFVRIENPTATAVPVTNDDGTVKVDEDGNPVMELVIRRTGMGEYLLNFGIMSADRTSDEGREGDMAGLLGDWMTYSQARSGYTYAYGGPRAEGLESHDLRGEFTLRNAGAAEGEGVTYYGAARAPNAGHGSHYDPSDPVVWDGMDELDPVLEVEAAADGTPLGSTDHGVPDPEEMPPPVLDRFGTSKANSLHDIRYRLP